MSLKEWPISEVCMQNDHPTLLRDEAELKGALPMLKVKKALLYLAPLVVLSLLPVVMSAQDNMSNMSNGKAPMSVTGCLKQGSDAHGFYMMGQDGKMYELMGPGLAAHVNHTVTVMGQQVTLSHAQEEKKEATEKAEAGSMSYVDMKVSSVKMVSNSCQ
jgi:hypothetical protein